MTSNTRVPLRALAAVAPFDAADVQIMALPAGDEGSATDWAQRVFSVRAMPGWVKTLMGLRQLLVGLVGIERGAEGVFDVVDEVDGEALIHTPTGHLDFAVSVARTEDLLFVTTAVKLHGWRGRLYWGVVQWFHAPVSRAMMNGAVRRAGRGSAADSA